MNKKRIISFFLLIVLVILCICSLNKIHKTPNADSADVPQIRITATEKIIKESYTDCSISIVDSTGSAIILDKKSSIKIRGNSTSSADKKPYNIKFSSKTDVMGMGQNKKWCLLANCYDKTLLRNITVFDFASAIGLPCTPDYKVVDVYVNDLLMGNYLLTDAIEVSPTRVNIDIQDNDFLLELDYSPEDEDFQYFTSAKYDNKFAINEPEKENLTDAQLTYVTDFIAKAEEALYSEDYNQISAFFDIDSMVDFYITLEFFKNVDLIFSSTRFHIKDGIIYGGPVWDFDLSAGNCCSDYYAMYFEQGDSGDGWEGLWATLMPWFDALMKCDEFKQKVKERYLDLQDEIVNLYAENELGISRIDEYLLTYGRSIERNQNEAGWTTDRIYAPFQLERTPDPTYEENVAFFRNWMAKRNEWLLAHWEISI